MGVWDWSLGAWEALADHAMQTIANAESLHAGCVQRPLRGCITLVITIES